MPLENGQRRAFAVVTDSTADIDAGIAAEHDIEVIPLSVTFGDETLPDGQLSQQQYFTRMNAAPQLPTTPQPSVGLFAEVYERALEVADSVVSVISTHTGTGWGVAVVPGG